ncbi:ABC transporter ATP-binding protein [[Mycoplasma] mobile]
MNENILKNTISLASTLQNTDAKNFQEETILKVKNLKVSFKTGRKKVINIIRGVDVSVKRGQIIGFVGESGSGKSVTSKALININFGAIVDADVMKLENIDLLSLKEDSQWNNIRGKYIGYIPQDPLTSLNPTRTIGKQLLDCIERDSRFKSKEEKIKFSIDLLESFGIRNAKEKFNSYPHTLSGGQKQRVVIAMVVARQPKIIIADEPTTALDPTVQASVLVLFEKIRQEFGISIIFISHNISVVAKFCDYIYVMYAGKIVERGTKKEIFEDPRHPYTWALISSIPENKEEKLYNIQGLPPDMANLPAGDPFASRNEHALEIDFEKEPPLFWINKTHAAATWLLHPDAPKVPMNRKIQERIKLFKKVFNE